MPTLSKKALEIPQSESIKFNQYVYTKKREGKDVIVLSLGEAFFDIPLFSFKPLPQKKLNHYSDSRGIPELRKIISKYYKKHYKVNCNPEKEVLITAGSKPIIYLTLLSILNPEEEVIMQEPAWLSYPHEVTLAGGKPVLIPYYKTIEDYEKYITKKTKAIIFCNPCNPSGKVYKKSELQYIYRLAKKYNFFIISDEAYSDFTTDTPFVSAGTIEKRKDRVIVINSLSKNLGISGWRIGYMIARQDLIDAVLKANQHIITCTATILLYYLSHYFYKIIKTARSQLKSIMRRRKKISNHLKTIGIKTLPGDGSFYYFASILPSKLNSRDFCLKLLEEYDTCAVPGVGYGKSCDSFIRLSIAWEPYKRVIKGLDNIKKLIDKTS